MIQPIIGARVMEGVMTRSLGTARTFSRNLTTEPVTRSKRCLVKCSGNIIAVTLVNTECTKFEYTLISNACLLFIPMINGINFKSITFFNSSFNFIKIFNSTYTNWSLNFMGIVRLPSAWTKVQEFNFSPVFT